MPASRKLKTAKVVGGTSSGRFLVLYQGCVRLTLTRSYRTARRYAPPIAADLRPCADGSAVRLV